MSSILNFLSPPEGEEDRDAVVELHLEQPAEPLRTRSGKRKKEEPLRVLPVSSLLLKAFSPKWRFTVESEEEVETYEDLLAFVHSLGKALPTGCARLLRLLRLAQQECVDAAILECAQALKAQAELSLADCMSIATALCSTLSPHDTIQAACASALTAALDRGLELLRAEPSLLQEPSSMAHLLGMLGRLDEMLRDPVRLRFLTALPAAAIKAFMSSEELRADIEETIFCTFATWMDVNGASLSAADRQQLVGDVIPLIRFPAMRAANLVSYWQGCSFLKAIDPENKLLIAAMLSKAERYLPDYWAAKADVIGGPERDRMLTAKWWAPRATALEGQEPLVHIVEVTHVPGKTVLVSKPAVYWAGRCWRLKVDKEEEGAIRVLLHCSSTFPDIDATLVMAHPPGILVQYRLRAVRLDSMQYHVQRHSGTFGAGTWWGARNCFNRARMADGSPVIWDNIFSEGSPFVHPGKVLRFEVKLAMA